MGSALIYELYGDLIEGKMAKQALSIAGVLLRGGLPR
jgi:hypothetical protein